MLGMLLLARVVLLGQIIFLPGMKPVTPGMVKPGSEQPATAPAKSGNAAADDSAGSDFGKSTIGKLFSGEKKLSPGDLGHAGFWVALVREPLSAAFRLIPRLFVAIIFALIFWGLYRFARKLTYASMGRAGVDPSIRDMLVHLIKWAIMGFGLVIAFNQLGIQISGVLAGVSIVGLAIGLAAQETLANFIAGIVIFCDKPFRVGDIVNIEEACGTIQRVTFRSTRMLTFDGEIVVLPNTKILSNKLLNHSTHTTGRVNISVGISYSASISAARQALLALVESDERVRTDPPPAVVVSELAESSVRLNFWFWSVDKSGVGKLKFEYMEKVKEALDAAGIEIPYPHMKIVLPGSFKGASGQFDTEFRVAG